MSLYLGHYGLTEPPFRITPHTDFFFDGAERGATLEALLYAVVHDEGIVKVVGEVGSGKTMLCRVLIERLPDTVDIVYLATPSLERDEILHAIGDELKIHLNENRKAVALRELQDHLIRLYGEGRRVVVLIDEAHVMPEETLEQVRLLSNLETARHKLLQIVLFGQPELDALLAKLSLRQLRDRITHGFRLRPLAPAEVPAYLEFRMNAAGYRGPPIFTPAAAARIARASSGLSRRINILADKSLLAAFTENAHEVDESRSEAAIADSEFAPPVDSERRRGGGAIAVAIGGLFAFALGGAVALWALRGPTESPVPANPPAAPPPAASEASPQPGRPGAVDSPVRADLPVAPAEAAPASAVPATAPPPVTALGTEQLERFSGYSPGRSPLLRERLDATRALLSGTPDDHHTIALFTSGNADPARMERFLVRALDLVPLEDLYVVPVVTGSGGTRTRYELLVTYGRYADREAAEAAASRLPPKYQRAFQFDFLRFGRIRERL